MQTAFGNLVISSKVTCRPHFPIKEENFWVNFSNGGGYNGFLLSVENRKMDDNFVLIWNIESY